MNTAETALAAVVIAEMVYCAVAYSAFVLRYRRLTWKHTREGRHLMGHSRVLAVMLWVTLGWQVFPPPLWLAIIVQGVLFAWLAFEATRRNRLLTLNQRDAADLARKALDPR